MEKNYKTHSLSFLTKTLVTGVLLFLSSSARAQLNGNYTLNSGATASATSFLISPSFDLSSNEMDKSSA